MDTMPATLTEALANRVEGVGRIGLECGRPRHRNRQRHVDTVIAQARAAIISGEAVALKAALSTVEFLSFELCED